MKVTYFGHSAFMIQEGGYTFLIDPFLTGNPHLEKIPEDMRPDYILLTHGHGDHVGDALKIALASDALLIAPFELATYCEKKGARVHPVHIGGAFGFPFGKVKLTQALHGSAVFEGDQVIYTGNPCGFLLTINQRTLYHAGDTGLFGDMKLIGDRNSIDIAFLPIGDNFTMGVEDAAYAVELLRPRIAVPMHYNTFGYIMQDPQGFITLIEEKGFAGKILPMGVPVDM